MRETGSVESTQGGVEKYFFLRHKLFSRKKQAQVATISDQSEGVTKPLRTAKLTRSTLFFISNFRNRLAR